MEQTVIEVGERDFEERVLEASRRVPVLVDFWAGWCRPCLVLGPVLEKLAGEHGGRFVLAKVNVDENPNLAAAFGVQGIPAVKAFRDGRVVDEFVGVQPEEAIRGLLRGLVPSEAEDMVEEAAKAEAAGDPTAAESGYRRALEVDPDHAGAALGLARILLARGEAREARTLLSRFPGDPEAARLEAEADLRERAPSPEELADLRARLDGGGDVETLVRVAAGEAVAGEPRAALERCLEALRGTGAGREAARDLMVRIFALLGDEHPLTQEFRPRLARALY